MAVAARYSIDGNWYRAKITSLPEPRMVTVFYVDFGNSETLQWDQLRVLDRRFIVTPPHVSSFYLCFNNLILTNYCILGDKSITSRCYSC